MVPPAFLLHGKRASAATRYSTTSPAIAAINGAGSGAKPKAEPGSVSASSSASLSAPTEVATNSGCRCDRQVGAAASARCDCVTSSLTEAVTILTMTAQLAQLPVAPEMRASTGRMATSGSVSRATS